MSVLREIQRKLNAIQEILVTKRSNAKPPPSDLVEFIRDYCYIYNPGGDGTTLGGAWIKFDLWESQIPPVRLLESSKLTIWLKARQLGMTWLALAYSLHLVLSRPLSTVLLFSRRDTEACELLQRLLGMHRRLPEKFQVKGKSNSHEWVMANGSRVMAFPTTAGDSYTATLAVVDEADLVPDLDRLLGSVKPTIDAGGKLLLLSRPDKAKPQSVFKRLYIAARDGESPWKAIFLPWSAHPGRDQKWYEDICADSIARSGTLDSVHEQYPSTDTEALSARALDKRLPSAWIDRCFVSLDTTFDPLALPGLTVYHEAEQGQRYFIGGDPAEGNPQSDDSAACVFDSQGTQVAVLAGKFEPGVFAANLSQLATYYNNASCLIERNNHGHAVLLWLRENTSIRLLPGPDGATGWLSNVRTKSLLYAEMALGLREDKVRLHDPTTKHQLSGIEGATLRAPEGEMDDYAMAAVLGYKACRIGAIPWRVEEIK